MTSSVEQLVDDLVAAYDPGLTVPLPHELVSLGLDDARRVRAGVVRRLCEVRGAAVAGYKVGLTSASARAALGARGPVYGELLDQWVLASPAAIGAGELHCPVVEAELAFVFDEALSPRASRDEITAKSRVAAALDVPDSRYAGWYPISDALVVDLVVDNAFAGRLVVADATVPTAEVDLVAAEVELRFDGEVVDRGSGGNVLGDPLAAVTWLSSQLADRRLVIEAGQVVSAGTMTAPSVGRPGRFDADFGELGTASVRIRPASAP